MQGNGVGNIGSVSNTLVDGNTSFAVQASSAGNVVGVVRSILTNSTNGINLVSGGTAISFGPSNIVSGGGAFTTTVNYKSIINCGRAQAPKSMEPARSLRLEAVQV